MEKTFECYYLGFDKNCDLGENQKCMAQFQSHL